jgi:hypothetical protein
MVYLFYISLITAFVFYQKSQFNDLLKKRNTQWKTWANVIKGILLVSFLVPHNTTWQDVFLALCIGALQFEFMYNKIVIKQDWFFYGTTSEFDELKNWKWVFLFFFLALSIVLKILT